MKKAIKNSFYDFQRLLRLTLCFSFLFALSACGEVTVKESTTSSTSGGGGSSSAVCTADCSPSNILCVDDTSGSTQEYATIQSAVNAAVAGDTVLVCPGIYTDSCVIGSCGGGNNYSADALLRANVKLKTSGTATNPITIKSSGDGEVIIDAQGSVEYNIYGVSYQYYIIDGITLKDALRTSLFWQGISSLDLTVKNSSFQGTASAPNYGYGISVNNSGDAANNNTTILNNTFSLPGAFVVIDITSSYNSQISQNTITGGEYGIYLHNYTYGSIIERNTLTGNTGDLTGIFIRDDDNFIIRYNLIKGNYGTQHILYQDSSGIGSTGVKILNNTIDCGTLSSTGIKESDTWAETTNNIIYNCFVDIRGIIPGSLPAGQPGYNILYDVPGRYTTSYIYYYGTGEQWLVSTGTGNLTSNPLFVSAGTNYSLQSGSPAVNAGDPATAAGTDRAGVSVPQGTRADIGAFELVP